MVSIFIVGSDRPTPVETRHLESQLTHLWYFQRLRSWNGVHVLLSDHYGADVYAANQCAAHDTRLPFTVYGVTARAFNGTGRGSYQRVAVNEMTSAERRRARDLYAVSVCDKVVAIGESERCCWLRQLATEYGKLPAVYDAGQVLSAWELRGLIFKG